LIIAKRGGHIVALLTGGGGGGITNATDVTFCIPYCELEKCIEVLPGARLLDLVRAFLFLLSARTH